MKTLWIRWEALGLNHFSADNQHAPVAELGANVWHRIAARLVMPNDTAVLVTACGPKCLPASIGTEPLDRTQPSCRSCHVAYEAARG